MPLSSLSSSSSSVLLVQHRPAPLIVLTVPPHRVPAPGGPLVHYYLLSSPSFPSSYSSASSLALVCSLPLFSHEDVAEVVACYSFHLLVDLHQVAAGQIQPRRGEGEDRKRGGEERKRGVESRRAGEQESRRGKRRRWRSFPPVFVLADDKKFATIGTSANDPAEETR